MHRGVQENLTAHSQSTIAAPCRLAARESAPELRGRCCDHLKGLAMSQIVYIVGAIVIVLAVLSFIGFG
ncbi:hypothetical protein [Roseovarius sp. D0-M9]|uniref:hypothetical protein n=1 Tax=Roseovarius sp. D0-M9 TaxID=3127117 RepID=UPI00300FCECB